MPTSISVYHCRCGSLDFDAVVVEHIGDRPYALPTMSCLDCGIVYVFSDPVRTERHHRHLSDMSHAARNAYSAAPARAGDRRQDMATAKKATAKKAPAKKTATQTTRGRNQDRALVASMEDYEVKYLATKHGVTQKAVKDAVAKVGNSRTKVERELKAGKA